MSQSNLTRVSFPDRHVGHTDRKTVLVPWDAAPGTARRLLFDTRWTGSTQGEVPTHPERRILQGKAPARGGVLLSETALEVAW